MSIVTSILDGILRPFQTEYICLACKMDGEGYPEGDPQEYSVWAFSLDGADKKLCGQGYEVYEVHKAGE